MAGSAERGTLTPDRTPAFTSLRHSAGFYTSFYTSHELIQTSVLAYEQLRHKLALSLFQKES